MTNRPFRAFDRERDIAAVQRIWIECGWINDKDDERAAVAGVFDTGEAEVATIDGEAECSVLWTPGTMQYQDETLELGAVTAVTTSHVARKLGFAKELTARSLARQYEAGMAVSALGMFDQGFYNQVGYGSGPYQTRVQFDPATLRVDAPFRPPRRLTSKDYKAVHLALSRRRKYHGAVVLDSPAIVAAEMRWTEKPFGLGYPDRDTLSHFIWGRMKGEHGPYDISMCAYQDKAQLLELLALIKSLGDQVSSFTALEFGDFQLQDLLDKPFRNERVRRGSIHRQSLTAAADWQLRILDLGACLAKTRLPGPGVRFNLQLTDPLSGMPGVGWHGLAGDYVVEIGEESGAQPGIEAGLPRLRASVNAFSRLWLGVRPASGIAVTDDLSGDESLIRALDRVLRLPRPHFGWDF